MPEEIQPTRETRTLQSAVAVSRKRVGGRSRAAEVTGFDVVEPDNPDFHIIELHGPLGVEGRCVGVPKGAGEIDAEVADWISTDPV